MNVLAIFTTLLMTFGVVSANPLEARCSGYGGKCRTNADCCAARCVAGVSEHTSHLTGDLSDYCVSPGLQHRLKIRRSA
jgi:hypothetical protein